jgi:hypothetical protein
VERGEEKLKSTLVKCTRSLNHSAGVVGIEEVEDFVFLYGEVDVIKFTLLNFLFKID